LQFWHFEADFGVLGPQNVSWASHQTVKGAIGAAVILWAIIWSVGLFVGAHEYSFRLIYEPVESLDSFVHPVPKRKQLRSNVGRIQLGVCQLKLAYIRRIEICLKERLNLFKPCLSLSLNSRFKVLLLGRRLSHALP
jgi:hypothetical protein